MKLTGNATTQSAGGSALVEAAMGMELLRSERRRVTLLLGLLAFVLAMVFAIHAAPQLLAPEIRDRFLASRGPLTLIICSYLAYELSIRIWLGRRLAARRALPRGFPYLNVLVEISLPTAALLIGGVMIGPLPILAGAIPFLYFLFVLLSALNLEFWLCVFAGAVACVEFLAASLYLVGQSPVAPMPGAPVLAMLVSPHQYVLKGALLLAAGGIAGFVARQIRRQLGRVLETLEERDRAVSIFGQHVSPQVAELLLKQPIDFAGQERKVCVMFLDIRDFSKLSSERTALEVVNYLNALFGPMIPIVNGHAGVVNKFLGDGFMAVFGAPVDDGQQCRHAVQAALEILALVDRLSRDGLIPSTRVGIGLHYGEAVTGNVGGAERKEYTIIGDVVNLASRIEQANKPLASQFLVSEAVLNALGSQHEFATEDMGLIELKGQPHPVRLYKLA
jgi:adenylate cyclase